MTLEEFKIKILGADIQNFSEEEVEGLFAITIPFSNFALKKYLDTKIDTKLVQGSGNVKL